MSDDTKLLGFIDEIVADGFRSDIADRGRRILSEIRSRMGEDIWRPSASTHEDGMLFFGWDLGRHHLEVEICPEGINDGLDEWFYCDRVTDEYWGVDVSPGYPLPDSIIDKLVLFTDAMKAHELLTAPTPR